jgi:hypothetical protein
MLSLALLIRLVDTMQLVGTGRCPDPVQVERRLEALSEPDAGEDPAVGEIDEIDAREIRLRLRNAQGAPLAERILVVGRSCAARAQASAVIFAAWQTEFTPAVPAFPEVRPAELAPPPHLEAQLEAPHPPPMVLELRAGIGAGWTASQVEPSLRLEAALLRLGGAWSAELGVTAGLPRQDAIGTGGGARWMRSSVALSGVRRWGTSDLDVHLEGGVALTLLTAHGVQLAADRSDSAWEGGLRAGLRLLFPARVAPWLLFDATFWPLARSMQVGGTPASVPLPSYELGLAIGGAFTLPLKGSEAPAD